MEPRDLGNGLVLRNATPEDVPAALGLLKVVHSEDIMRSTAPWFEKHPRMTFGDIFIVEDTGTGKIVSHAIQLPGTWILDGLEIPMIQMEVVGTLEQYRHQGLMRAINTAYDERAVEVKPVSQAVAGIPYFYRELGYEYAVPMESGFYIAPSLIPDLPDGQHEIISIRKNDFASFPEWLEFRRTHLPKRTWLKGLGQEDFEYHAFDECKRRNEAFTFCVVEDAGETVGAFYYMWSEEDYLEVGELYLSDSKYADAVLRHIKNLATSLGGITFEIRPPNQPQLYEYIKAKSRSTPAGTYMWYVKIPSIPRFLLSLKEHIHLRLQNTDFERYTGQLTLTNYKEGFTLTFENGHLIDVVSNASRDYERYYDLRIPKGPLVKLLMGHSTFDELKQYDPDIQCKAARRPLVRALFPRFKASIDPFY
jgi:hypothetical protein